MSEAVALAWLRSTARNRDEVIAALHAMCSGQDGDIADRLLTCALDIDRDTPDELDLELPEPNNGNGEFDRASGAMPLWMMLTGGQS